MHAACILARGMANDAPSSNPLVAHSRAYRLRRFVNWFPLGLTYALLYMGRYNLTVAKGSLGQLMTKEEFGWIFGVGSITYALAFLINGPMIDRIGGRRGMLIGAAGAFVANVAMGAYLHSVVSGGHADDAPIFPVFVALYAVNMYFQSYGAVSIVKVNAHWFHVTERGGFSGIFGTMISSGIFLAFTVNGKLLDLAEWLWPDTSGPERAWIVFAVPGALLALFLVIELFILRDRPSDAGHEDFDTGDASSGDTDGKPVPTLQLFKRIFTNPISMTVALIELCTGVLRNGVMHWFPIYAKEIWALPSDHLLRNGAWDNLWLLAGCVAVAVTCFIAGAFLRGRLRATLVILGALFALVPFFQGGWGGLLMIAGILGGNVAGWVSDLFFQSRRGPVAAVLYLMLLLSAIAMGFSLAKPTNVVSWAADDSGLRAGDEIVAIAGVDRIEGWADVRDAVSCWEPVCERSRWNAEECVCMTDAALPERAPVEEGRPIPARVRRDGRLIEVHVTDPAPRQRASEAGEASRLLTARPQLPLSPWVLGVIVFLISLSVSGTHGVLSGTATMDFGGRKGAATAVGVIDGFVYLGSTIQSISLGYITTRDWVYWPWFLVPFPLIGFVLSLRIWNAKPKGKGAH